MSPRNSISIKVYVFKERCVKKEKKPSWFIQSNVDKDPTAESDTHFMCSVSEQGNINPLPCIPLFHPRIINAISYIFEHRTCLPERLLTT